MKVKVNEHYQFEVEVDDKRLILDGHEVEIDSVKLSDSHTHFIYNNRSYSLELVSENKAEKTCVVKVNGHHYAVALEDQYDQLLKQLGLDSLQANKVHEIKAPMPGLVLKIIATEGIEVNKGDNLLILEAMKMENIIKSPAKGIVNKILINQGDKVEKNQILIQFN